MSLIIQPSKLVVCSACRKHAHMILPNELVGPEFAFKRQGYNILYNAVERFGMSLVESGELREQIRNCPLPEEHLEVKGHLLWTVEKWNLYRIACYPEQPSFKFHRLFRQTRKSSIPEDYIEQLDNALNVGVHPENPKTKMLH